MRSGLHLLNSPGTFLLLVGAFASRGFQLPKRQKLSRNACCSKRRSAELAYVCLPRCNMDKPPGASAGEMTLQSFLEIGA